MLLGRERGLEGVVVVGGWVGLVQWLTGRARRVYCWEVR